MEARGRSMDRRTNIKGQETEARGRSRSRRTKSKEQSWGRRKKSGDRSWGRDRRWKQENGTREGVGNGSKGRRETKGRGWREPGTMTLQRGRIFGMVLIKRSVTDQEVRPGGQRQSRKRTEKNIPGSVQNY